MICPACKANNIPEKSLFCNMCGVNLMEAEKIERMEQEKQCRAGTIPLVNKEVMIGGQTRSIQVWCKDITELDTEIDLLTISAYPYSYIPTETSVIGALYRKCSLSVQDLANDPLLDLRRNAGCWISGSVPGNGRIRRIGGVEVPAVSQHGSAASYESRLIKSIQSYMRLVDILSEYDSDIRTIVFPLLGTGNLQLNHELMIIPLLGEVMQLLSRNKYIEKIIFVERRYEKAKMIADAVNNSYNVNNETGGGQTGPGKEKEVFISYTEKGDRKIAELIGKQLSEQGISYWFAPSSILAGDYASEIVKGINKCTHFVCIISENSMKSTHVLNEVDLAFKRIHEGIKIIPFKLDNQEVAPAFEYYLSRMNWKSSYPPPLDKRIAELVSIIV